MKRKPAQKGIEQLDLFTSEVTDETEILSLAEKFTTFVSEILCAKATFVFFSSDEQSAPVFSEKNYQITDTESAAIKSFITQVTPVFSNSINNAPLILSSVDGTFQPFDVQNVTIATSLIFFIANPAQSLEGFCLLLPEDAGSSDDQILLITLAGKFAAMRYNSLKTLERTLQAEEILKLHDRALMTSSNGVVITDARAEDNPIIYVNAAFEQMTGYSRAESLGRNCRFLSFSETSKDALAAIRHGISTQTECSAVLLNKRKDGSLFWNDLHISPIKNDEGQITHFIGVQSDVTEKIEAAQGLKESALRMTTLMQNLQAGILLEDENRRIVLTNAEFCKMFSIPAPPEALLGMDCSSSAEDSKHLFVNPEQFVADIARTLADRLIVRSLELQLVDGRIFERDYIPIFMAENYKGHLWQYRDITERKRSEQQVKHNEERYRKIIHEASEIIFSMNLEGSFTLVNPAARRVFEYSDSELIERPLWSFVRSDYRERVSKFYYKQLSNHTASTYLEFPVISRSGKEIWFAQNVHLIVENDSVLGLHAVARDITELRKYQDEIKSLKEFYERILTDLPGQIAVFDTDLRYLFVNPESLRDPELRDWIIGHDDYEYCRRRGLDESIAAHRQTFLKVALETKRLHAFEEKVVYPNGKTMHFFRAVNPILDKKKNVQRLIGYGVDITARKQAEEERDRFFNLSSDLLCIIGFDASVKRINPAFEKLFGYTADEFLSTPIFSFVLDEDRERAIAIIQSVRNGGTIKDFECRIVAKNGVIYWISWQATAFVEGGLLYAVGRDITQRKQIDEELLRAKSTAEESTRAKERFLAHMSHEIRTPMNAVLGLSHLLLEMHPSPEQEQFLNAIKFSSENLLVIINDILDFSKIEAGKIDYISEPFLLDELFDQIKQTVTFSMSEKNLAFNIEINPTVPNILVGDKVRLNQILLNLVSNAVKFTQEGAISILCRIWDETEQSVILMIQVRDTGIGIKPEDLKKIFDRFEQVGQSRKTKVSGTGLGLAIVKGLVENQGGSIVAESIPDKGSVFTILMPFKKHVSLDEPEPPVYGVLPEPESTPDTFNDLRVLVAEDNQMNQLVVSSMLKLWNVEFKIAQNGLEAFEMTRDEDFDLILMDISMPELDGYEATQKIRTELPEPKKDIFIIALTASAMIESKNLVMQSGMNDYLSKPFKPHELQLRLARARGIITVDKSSVAKNELQSVISAKVSSLDSLRDIVGGDLLTMYEMINLFLSQTPAALDRMLTLNNTGDWKELYKAAHRLRPTLGYMGITEAVEIMLNVEKSALSETGTASIERLLNKVAALCRIAYTELVPEMENLKQQLRL